MIYFFMYLLTALVFLSLLSNHMTSIEKIIASVVVSLIWPVYMF